MGTDDNKAVVRRFIGEVFEKGDSGAVDELLSRDFVPHTWPSTGDGRGDLKRAMERVSKGLSDVSFSIDDLIAEGDQVVARLTASATQTDEFMGMPPSGKRYTIPENQLLGLLGAEVGTVPRALAVAGIDRTALIERVRSEL